MTIHLDDPTAVMRSRKDRRRRSFLYADKTWSHSHAPHPAVVSRDGNMIVLPRYSLDVDEARSGSYLTDGCFMHGGIEAEYEVDEPATVFLSYRVASVFDGSSSGHGVLGQSFTSRTGVQHGLISAGFDPVEKTIRTLKLLVPCFPTESNRVDVANLLVHPPGTTLPKGLSPVTVELYYQIEAVKWGWRYESPADLYPEGSTSGSSSRN